MEAIRKKICLESGRSRKQGLLPFVAFNEDSSIPETAPFTYPTTADTNGNFGGFVADFSEKEEGAEKHIYCDENREYNEIMDQLIHGIVLKKVSNSQDRTFHWVETTADFIDIFNTTGIRSMYYIADINKFISVSKGVYDCSISLGYINPYINVILVRNLDVIKKYLPGNWTHDYITNSSTNTSVNLYNFCKYFERLAGLERIDIDNENIRGQIICVCDIKKEYEWMSTHSDATDCCTKQEWESRGGNDMMDWLYEHLNDYDEWLEEIHGLYNFHVPSIDVPLLLTSKYTDLGLYDVYEESAEDYSGDTESQWEYVNGVTVESKLSDLRLHEYYYDDDGNLLPGVFDSQGRYKYYKVENGTIAGISASEVANESYNTYTIERTVPLDVDGYAFVMYENGDGHGAQNPMSIPYKVGIVFNEMLIDEENEIYAGDFITDIIYNDDITGATKVTIQYVLGGNFTYNVNNEPVWNGETGVLYKEEYGFVYGQSMEVNLDGTTTTIYYNEIQFDASKKEFKHLFINSKKLANVANVIGQRKNDILTSETAQIAPLYKADYLLNTTDTPQTEVNVTINRGNAAAFEKHLKLSECNTMEDLVNISNNFFNL